MSHHIVSYVTYYKLKQLKRSSLKDENGGDEDGDNEYGGIKSLERGVSNMRTNVKY